MMTRGSYITTETIEQIEERVWKCSGMVKTMLAMPNNVAYIMLYNAHDKAKTHPAYRHEAKRLFKRTVEEYREYEKGLYCAQENRMFHVGDMNEQTRKRYGDITDRDYFELWQDMGSKGYELALPHLQALTHKFRLSLRRRNIQEADILCHLLTASAVMEIALSFYRSATDLCKSEFKLPEQLVTRLYGGFSLQRVKQAWERACTALAPYRYPLEEIEEKNIAMSISDIADTWSEQDNMLAAVIDAVENNEELFRTRGEMKKVLRICTQELDES